MKVAYTGESDTTVTALGGSSKLFDVVVDELATRGLDHPSTVRGGVVGSPLAESNTLGHCCDYIKKIGLVYKLFGLVFQVV